MLFSSYIFLFVFLPVTLVGFCLLSRWWGAKPAKIWLTLASLFFYGWWNPIYVGLIMASMLFNYWLGRQIGRAIRSGGSGGPQLFMGVAANLLLLGYFKYANFFVSNVNAVLGGNWAVGKVILPLGISFFTFTQIAYLIDARRGVVCEYDLGDFLLFITFFPHLIAGPIIHHSEMMPQFAEPKTYRFQWENLAVGLGIFSIGLFKKVVIADGLSGHALKVFDAAAAGTAMSASDAWAGTLSYTFQIYFDFSGYSDMAIALARMFGITLPLNFNSPYKAVNIIEFWRRWHMTLSRFLRDYLYISLGGNRRGTWRRYLNLLVTMTIGGLWHGAAWTFVLWGLFHGACLALNHLWQAIWTESSASVSPGGCGGVASARPTGVRGETPPLTRRRDARATLRRWPLPGWLTCGLGRSLTLLLVVLGWVLFRSTNLHAAQHLLAAMFGFGVAPVAGAAALLKIKIWVWLAGLLTFVWWLPNTAEILSEQQPYPAVLEGRTLSSSRWWGWRQNAAWACLAGLLLAAAVLSLSRSGEFLYYNF
ncbi:MAG TPA: MBOAT family protein [Candidatus Binatia bacterium]|jgi:alginate O-acetyltransferase complex protein AlgI|nr:MBOAT family protein [Candidatus Binatia bacterium]